MKAQPNKAVPSIDPEESPQTEDPLWAPSWTLPRVEREPGERHDLQARVDVEPDPLARIPEGLPDAG